MINVFFYHYLALPVFGVSLHEAVKRSMLPDGVQIPRIIRECIMEIEDKGQCFYFNVVAIYVM